MCLDPSGQRCPIFLDNNKRRLQSPNSDVQVSGGSCKECKVQLWKRVFFYKKLKQVFMRGITTFGVAKKVYCFLLDPYGSLSSPQNPSFDPNSSWQIPYQKRLSFHTFFTRSTKCTSSFHNSGYTTSCTVIGIPCRQWGQEMMWRTFFHWLTHCARHCWRQHANVDWLVTGSKQITHKFTNFSWLMPSLKRIVERIG